MTMLERISESEVRPFSLKYSGGVAPDVRASGTVELTISLNSATLDT